MTQAERRDALNFPKPEPPWRGEPQLGGWYTEEEFTAANEAMRSSMDWKGEGFGFIVNEILDFEAAFAAYCGTEYAISLCTASIGLDLLVDALDLQPGDEVIVPSANFRAAPLAVLGRGGRVVFCEVDEGTLQADPEDVEARITERTRAILPVHMNGLSAPMDDLLAVARRAEERWGKQIPVIGDAARACGGGYRGGKIGKLGWGTVFSFHTMKLMTTLGEGGMVTTDDPELAAYLRDSRQWGQNNERRWGSSYKLTKVQAAVGSVQLRRLDEMIGRRRAVAARRHELLADVAELTLPLEPPDRVHTYYLYTTFVPDSWAGAKRDRVIQICAAEYGVGCVIANPPVYEQCPYVARQTEDSRTPRAERLGARIICLPMHPLMTEEENAYACAALQSAVEKVAAR